MSFVSFILYLNSCYPEEPDYKHALGVFAFWPIVLVKILGRFLFLLVLSLISVIRK